MIRQTAAFALIVLLAGIFPQAAQAALIDPDNALYPAMSPPPWSNSQGWDRKMYWGTILAGDPDGGGIEEPVGCGSGGLEIWGYVSDTGAWAMQGLLKEPADDAEGGVYSQASYWSWPA